MRAARAKVGQACKRKRLPLAGILRLPVEKRQSGAKPLGIVKRPDPGGDDAGDLVGMQVADIIDEFSSVLVETADDAWPTRFGQAVAHISDRVLDLFELVFDDEDVVEPVGEFAVGIAVDREGHRDLQNTNADRRHHSLVDAEVGERLQHVAPGLAHRGDAEAGTRTVVSNAVQPVGARELDSGRQLVAAQAILLQVIHVADAGIDAIGRKREVRPDKFDMLMLGTDRRSGFDCLRQQLVADPGTAESRQLDAVQSEIEHILDVGRIQGRHQQVLEDQFRCRGNDRRAHRRVVAGQDQDSAVPGRAKVVSLSQRIHGLVEPGALAVPHREHAVIVGIAEVINLLGAPDRRRGHVFVGGRPEADVMGIGVLLRTPELDVDRRHRRAAVTGDKARSIQAGGEVTAPLHQQHADQCLRSGAIHTPGIECVFILQGNCCGIHDRKTRIADKPLSLYGPTRAGQFMHDFDPQRQ